jgi:hypothetical protein
MTNTQDIHDSGELELSYDPLIDVSDITVNNLNGEVALNGTVPQFPAVPGGGRSGAARLGRQECA